jgi:acetyl esterase/lipase
MQKLRNLFVASLLAFQFINPALRADDKVDIRPDVVYGHKDGMALTFDVFTPKKDAKGIGLLFMVSGGWYSGWNPPEQAVHGFRPMLDHGYTIIAVRHGSSPRYRVPEAVADVKLALKYVSDHADDLHVDRNKLGVYGFSAGGHLSLMLGTQTNDLVKENGSNPPHVAAVVAIFPPTDLAPYVELGNPLREQFPSLQFDPKEAGKVSPLLSVTADDAPTLLFHGDKDELVPIFHSEKIEKAFKDAKVETKLVVFPGAAHGFSPEQMGQVVQQSLQWFDDHLK